MSLIRTLLIAVVCLVFCKYACANPVEALNVDAEAEYDFSNFQRTPDLEHSEEGNNLSQQYKIYLEGGVLNQGMLDSMLGVSLRDKYRKNAVDFNNKVRLDYGRWFQLNTLADNKTDEDIFFSSAPAEPQSPVHSLIKKYDSRVALTRTSSVEYGFDETARKDLFLGTITNEDTKSQRLGFNVQEGPLTFNSEYHKGTFRDFLGIRSNIDSQNLNLEASYRPLNYLTFLGSFEDNKDSDVTNNTSLRSRDSRFEIGVKPVEQLRVRNRTALRENNDTKSQENISDTSNETIVNITPSKQLALELAYEYEKELKDRASLDISSTINKERIKISISPVSKVDIQTGYEVYDKSSTYSSENIENTKAYADVSFEPLEHLRLGGSAAETKQKNTFTSLEESDTKSISGSLQYRPRESISLFLQADSSNTDNPLTGMSTNTDTISSNLDVKPFSFLDTAWRMSSQDIGGSLASASSRRLLNALEFNAKATENLRFSAEYEFIDSTGQVVSNENLFDISAFYNLGKFDWSLHFQSRNVSGDNSTDKQAVLSDIKYKFSRDAVFSLKFSYTDYNDNTALTNSYKSSLVESLISLRF